MTVMQATATVVPISENYLCVHMYTAAFCFPANHLDDVMGYRPCQRVCLRAHGASSCLQPLWGLLEMKLCQTHRRSTRMTSHQGCTMISDSPWVLYDDNRGAC